MRASRLIAVLACLCAVPFVSEAQRHDVRGPAPHGGYVDRSNHGSLRHEQTHVVRAPEVRHEERPNVVVTGGPSTRYVHHDVDVDVHRNHFWNDFARGRHIGSLPRGFLSFRVGGLPYFYYGGVYYQTAPDGYEEVFPPPGAVLPEPPEGAFEVIAPDGQVYYYAAGGFYQHQPNGFVLVPPPVGVVVPELPPGATEVNVAGVVAYQFNGMYYQPVFVNGVTQYETFVP